MSQPVNLNKFRKASARVEKQTRATANTIKFGQTKMEKSQIARNSANAERNLDAHKRDDPK